MSNFRYFKDSEIQGLISPLPAMLDMARGIAGIPFVINSGFRTKEQNDALPNSVKNSAHLTGEAVDIRCKDSNERFAILKGLIQSGFTRIGLGTGFVHADISKTLPQGVTFIENC